MAKTSSQRRTKRDKWRRWPNLINPAYCKDYKSTVIKQERCHTLIRKRVIVTSGEKLHCKQRIPFNNFSTGAASTSLL